MSEELPASAELPSPHRLVRSAAGSGKTYALTTHYLGCLANGAPSSTILATTFTRKAAGEILRRVLLRLAAAATREEAAAALASDLALPALDLEAARRLLGELCRRLHQVQISTLDSFFHRMVSAFRLDLDVPANFSLAAPEDPRVARVRARALDSLLDELARQDWDALLEMVRHIHDEAAKRSVAADLDAVLVELYDVYQEVPEESVWQGPEGPAPLSEEELEARLAKLAHLQIGLQRGLRQGLVRNRQDAEAGNWEGFLSQGLAGALCQDPPRHEFRRVPIPRALQAGLGPLIDHARARLLGRVADRTRATHRLLRHFHAHFTRLRNREGLLLFSDLARKLARELPALESERLLEIYYRLDARVAHLLLDEFQDTSLDQWKVLRPVAEEVRSHGDGSRTLFCVGDPNQAIYGWRGGCAALFGQVEQELALPAGAGQVLDVSYRSSPIVLTCVDRVFAGLPRLPLLAAHRERVGAWLEAYTPHRAVDPERPGYVELLTSPAGRAEPGADPGQEEGDPHLDFVAATAAQLSARMPGRSLGVLMQTNGKVHALLERLRRLGVAASGEGGSPIADDPAVALILSTLLLADHPGDSVAAFHVAGSPLADVLEAGPGGEPEARLSGAIDSFACPQQVAAAIRRRLADVGVARLITEWARQLEPHGDAIGGRRLGQLVGLADRYETASGLRPGELVELVRASAVEDPSPGPVRVMTVHKAKGLEFDVVLLGELDRRLARTEDLLLHVDRSTPTGPVRRVFRASATRIRRHDAQLQAAHEQEVSRRLWDDLSGLYVAMTRARHGLHLIAKPLLARRDGRPSEGRLTYASLLRQALRPELEAGESLLGEHRLYQDGDPDWPSRIAEEPVPAGPGERRPASIRRRSPRGSRPRRLVSVRPSRPGAADRRIAAAELLRVEGVEQRRRGRLIHAWLEEIEWYEPGSPPPGRQALHRIARRVVPEAEPAWVAERMAELGRMLAQPQVARALARPRGLSASERVELWRERRFAQVLGGRLLSGAFDRVVVVRRSGRPVGAELFDFKSDRLSRAELAAAVERHRAQIEAYRSALAAMLGLLDTAIQARLVFLTLGATRSL